MQIEDGDPARACHLAPADVVCSSLTPAVDLAQAIGTLGTSSGLYLALVASVANVAAGPASEGLKPNEASRIDSKLDDGRRDRVLLLALEVPPAVLPVPAVLT